MHDRRMMTLFPRAAGPSVEPATAHPAGDGVDARVTRTGLSPRVLAVLAYALWWVTGGLVLVIEPDDPYVRFHARQAFRVFGVIWLAGGILWGLGLLLLLTSMTAFRILAVMGQGVWVVGIALWVVAMVHAWRGRLWAVPWLGANLKTDN